MWSRKDPNNLFKKCEKCNNTMVCGANLKVLRTETKAIDWHFSIGSQAAGKLLSTILSVCENEIVRFNSSDTVVALDLLNSLAVKLDWCTGKCYGKPSELKFDVIDDECKEATLQTCYKCRKILIIGRSIWAIRDGVSLGFMSTSDGLFDLVLDMLRVEDAFARRSAVESLGATGLSVLLFGSITEAMDLLSPLAGKLKCCFRGCNYSTALTQYDLVKVRLVVTKIANLESLQSPDFQLGDAKWNMKVFKQSDHLAIGINSAGSAKIRGLIELIAMNDKEKSIRKAFTKHVASADGAVIDEIIEWDNFLAPNAFKQHNSITIEVKMRVKDEVINPLPMECLLCFANLRSQQMSSISCGHIFCTNCIVGYVKMNAACPTCEAAANLNDLRQAILSM